ncbi:phosphoadenosine phosphosulfate reductase family protein [Sporomusa sphaeroides DSM 2875]|uniref:phosphoadenosine phosphosulfate reductase domain-containing protein n=1 Tax=Sporomusa sphaeroides TaxID=47679 RepID=UPI00202FB5AE|nr:phosphoadenosine phosphosulfate reductase family protein [Sporomusa sphaeroides]MCM0758080.1 phosphoadenosine phosphosulfate reductase family protein [Sporomusa sphaeroides DSM 2875]
MKVCWFSAGVSSFVAAYLERETLDKIIYIHIDNQHSDSLRFVKDCEKALGIEIEIVQSPYKSIDNVFLQYRFIARGYYSPKCTEVCKKRVRKEWEHGRKGLTYVWGMDYNERHRAEAIVKAMPKQNHVFPLIDRMLTKEECHGIAAQLRVKRPVMYDMGYQNNNCIGCVKGGMWYWNKIRVDFPEVFAERARQERLIGHSCINGVFLDELDPTAGRIGDEISMDCGIMCQIYSEGA